MAPAQKSLMIELEGVHFEDPAIPVASNVDARFTSRDSTPRDTLIRQVTGPVRWVECINLLTAQSPTHFIEVGPGKVLSGLNRQILGRDAATPTLNVEDPASLEKTLSAILLKLILRKIGCDMTKLRQRLTTLSAVLLFAGECLSCSKPELETMPRPDVRVPLSAFGASVRLFQSGCGHEVCRANHRVSLCCLVER